MSLRIASRLAGLTLLLPLMTGCGSGKVATSVYPVEGKVLYQGKPAVGATVVLHPLDKTADEGRPHGRTDAEGRFSISTLATDDGAPIGQYAVTVELWKAGKSLPHDEASPPSVNVVPVRYSRPESSGFKVVVEAKPNQLQPLELKR